MDRDDIIRKIKACLALSKSAEPHEAAAALRQAQKLTEQLGIDEVDLQLSDVHESRSPASALKPQQWEGRLAQLVGEAFGCELYLGTTTSRDASGLAFRVVTAFVFVGVAPADETASYAFDVLLRQCKQQRRAHVSAQPKNCKPSTKAARGDVFAAGWVRGVQALVGQLASPPARSDLLLAYMKRNHPNLGTANLGRRDRGRKVRHTDYLAGHAAGKNAQLHHGVGRGAAPLTIGGPK